MLILDLSMLVWVDCWCGLLVWVLLWRMFGFRWCGLLVWVVGVGRWCGLLVCVVALHSQCSLMDCNCLDLQTVDPDSVGWCGLLVWVGVGYLCGLLVLVDCWCGLLVWLVNVG